MASAGTTKFFLNGKGIELSNSEVSEETAKASESRKEGNKGYENAEEADRAVEGDQKRREERKIGETRRKK